MSVNLSRHEVTQSRRLSKLVWNRWNKLHTSVTYTVTYPNTDHMLIRAVNGDLNVGLCSSWELLERAPTTRPAGTTAATALSLTPWFRGYLESLQSGLFLLQGLLLLLLVHAAEGHAGGGERRDGAGQGGRSARHETDLNIPSFFLSLGFGVAS